MVKKNHITRVMKTPQMRGNLSEQKKVQWLWMRGLAKVPLSSHKMDKEVQQGQKTVWEDSSMVMGRSKYEKK